MEGHATRSLTAGDPRPGPYSPECVEGGLSRSISTLFAAVAASHPYLIMAMRIASALGKSLSLLRMASSGGLRSRGAMIRSSAPPSWTSHPFYARAKEENTSLNK